MADEATTAPTVEVPAPAATTEPTQPAQTNGENGISQEHEDDKEAIVGSSAEERVADDDAQAQEAGTAAGETALDGTQTPGSKDKKRKSTGGVPEHKTKKLNKKKSMPTLHLECKPGEFYWARLKGYPPWPSVICDEEMLPESLLASRPVSTSRPDGSIRDDFKEGGKNAKERTFPIMFLATNEFQWMVNTNLTPLEPEECKTLPQSKMTKALQSAYQIASEGHDIHYFKKILRTWQEEEEMIRKAEEEAAAEAERTAAEKAAKAEEEAAARAQEAKDKPKKKAARKSKAADEDVEMEDIEAPKSGKKRKKDAESDGEIKPKKTPKVMKLNAPKTPNGDSAKKSTTKSKKKVVTAPKVEEEDESKPQLTEEEKLAQREKAVLYLRHRLQKGFLSRDQAPQESEMGGMAEFISQLEAYDNLEPSIIRATKIHKVLKAIVKLASVPKDDEFQFKKRSSAMLEVWNKRMEVDGEAAAPPSAGAEKDSAAAEEKSETEKAAENPAAEEHSTGEQESGKTLTNGESASSAEPALTGTAAPSTTEATAEAKDSEEAA